MLATNITPGHLSPSRPQLRPAAAHILQRDLVGALGNPSRPVAFRQGGPYFISAPFLAGILAGAMNETRGNGRDPVRTAPLGEKDGTDANRPMAGIAGASLTIAAPAARRRRRPKAPSRAPRDQQEKREE